MKAQVLLLDDEPYNLFLLDELLRSLGDLEITAFSSPVEALAWCRQNVPDLCLIDYRMPGMDGVEFLAHVRAISGFEGVPRLMISGTADGAVRREAILNGALDFVAKPYSPDELKARVENLLRLRLSFLGTAAIVNHALPSKRTEIEHREHERILQKLADLSCTRDEETGNHMRRVAHIARLIAREKALAADFCDLIFAATPMHDVGKVAIPDRILLKPGKLTAAEWEIMKSHTTIGYELLKDSNSPLLQMGATIAYSHHEQYNGAGYPHGLVGEGIPIAGRIVAVADGIDALLSTRPYKEAWNIKETMAYLWTERGKRFDPRCVDIVLRHIDDILEIENRYADEDWNLSEQARRSSGRPVKANTARRRSRH